MSRATTPIWAWEHDEDGLHVRFLGRGASPTAEDLPSRLDPPPRQVGWLRQIHSGLALDARPGSAGDGDALVTGRPGLALAIATADCVPVLLAGRDRVAAVHAGWRGLVAGVIHTAVSRLGLVPSEVRAWVGPSIGRCCYEVGDDVALRLTDAGGGAVARSGSGARPHVDLQRIADHQLRTAGVERVETIRLCTRCHPDRLWSYRRDGGSAGRNWAVIWRAEP